MEEITNKKGVPAVAVVGIVLLAAIIFGAGAYMYANNQATQEKDALNAQIVTLQNEVLSAKKVATTTSNSSTPATNTDDKVASTEKPSVPSDWKTYKNTKYGYSLNYPNNLKTHSFANSLADVEDDNIAINPTATAISMDGESGFVFSVTSEKIQFTTDEIKSFVIDSSSTIKEVTLTPVTIAGSPAYQVRYSEIESANPAYKDTSDLYYIQSPSGTVLQLSVGNNSDGQKILSSFAFEK